MGTASADGAGGLLPGMRRVIAAALPVPLARLVTRRRLERDATGRGLRIERRGAAIEVVAPMAAGAGERVLRIAAAHDIYLADIVVSFDYYFGAVHAEKEGPRQVVDYSEPRLHRVVGFDDFPVLFPSFAEPVVTTQQYLEFAALQPGMGVLDLGAYAGLTSILFARAVSPGGRVVAVDADRRNLPCLEHNAAAWAERGGQRIDIVYGAVWNHGDGLLFSAEGNMGSSAVEIVGRGRGDSVQVPTFTLSQIVERCALERVDFVKCDIEGAERVALGDGAFFARWRPRLILETHLVDGEETTQACIDALTCHGYRCRRMEQHGVTLPLLACSPEGR